MNTFTRIITTTIGLVAVLAISAVADDTIHARAHIPFGFTVDRTAMTAGVYSVSRFTIADGVIIIRGGTQSVMLMTRSGGLSSTQAHAKFVFNRYGNRYFLREVWLAGRDAHTLREGRAERESAAELRRVGLSPTVVTVEATLN
jgi:hypothetical protein